MKYMHKALALCAMVLIFGNPIYAQLVHESYFGIRVVDAETGLGVPLVKLRTTANVEYFTDSQGWVAFLEPGLMDQDVYFHIESEGYDYPPDFLGYRGVTVRTTPGDSTVVQVRRTQVAQRLYRTTGQGIYRDSYLLNRKVPLESPLLNGQVMGQDSNLGTIYRGKAFWIWGDTFKASYPWGNFSISAAISDLPGSGGLQPEKGIDYRYFVDSTGFSKPMIKLDGPGFVWFDWIVALGEADGETLYAKYARVKTDFTNHERGIARFNDKIEMFEKIADTPQWLDEYHTTEHPVLADDAGTSYLYFTSEFKWLRSQPLIEDLVDPERYEAFTCLTPGSDWNAEQPAVDRDSNGKALWGWKKNTPPLDFTQQMSLLDAGHLAEDEAGIAALDIRSGDRVNLRRGSVNWNPYRKKWILICQADVGETWYGEADAPTGPWVYLTRVANHAKHFYNPVQHEFLDADSGRVVFFEGTYTNIFAPTPFITPRYEYNQLMYKLDLSSESLLLPEPVYEVVDANGYKDYLFTDELTQSGRTNDALPIAFFAFKPDRKLSGLVPIFKKRGEGGLQFSNEGNGSPSFFAIPSSIAPGTKLTGTWHLQITDGFFTDLKIDMSLEVQHAEISGSVAIPGWSISSVVQRGDSLFFKAIQFDKTYEISSKLTYNKLTGTWSEISTGGIGTISGLRRDYGISVQNSPLVEPLVKAQIDGRAQEESVAIVCYVWRNPLSSQMFSIITPAGE